VERDRPNILFPTYEEMQRDPTAAIRRIARFLSVDLTENDIDTVVRLSSVSHMKKSKFQFDPGQVVPWATIRGPCFGAASPAVPAIC